ncbi:HD domain-containing phosphohydrolase [Sulfurirhabdus autotrophica]|uniref:Response regulator RpfG family c-di-GMP phosphodiesterase n=1 Tax=Sulfurirhabdus autotrophica TaxID=1706046 RepID=A0A4R3YCD8_9PROT|nr:HD domain-containing phosphohydrolase [Sulfurirhabdus autotrophica]TCV89650.1 response regulator RpfG family c-di-GMP phosphodiesterase [Sulfurirhabdus autotrophica]
MSEMQATSTPQAEPAAPSTLLFVDDEANILSSLKRLFRPFGYRIFTAESGAEGLEIMERDSVDLVVSDMRMPEMNGAQFLEKVREKWPDTVRILLTGYAEMEATIDAINKGQIYRYISKPWEDNDITLTVKQALERKQLEREKERLEALTQKQFEELKEFNATLESKVKSRTEEVRQTMGFLEVANDNLKKSFITTVRVFANLIEMREGKLTGHSRRVADLSKAIAQQMGIKGSELQDIFLAGLLHDVGKIGLPDRLLEKPFSGLTAEERAEVVKHPAKGQAALMALEQLQGAAKLIRSHRERVDGMGFPEKLIGDAIPLGARIIAVATDYDAVQTGSLLSKVMSPAEATSYILEGNGKRYDSAVVKAFIKVTDTSGATQPIPELPVKTDQLQPGMKLSRDLLSKDGGLLLSKDHVIDDNLIAQIRNFEVLEDRLLTIYIYAKKGS